jgi:hypothetical protein
MFFPQGRRFARRPGMALRLGFLASSLGWAACTGSAGTSAGGFDAAAMDAGAPEASAPDVSVPEALPARRCFPGPGISGAPASIAEAVRLVNSLPHPVSVTCFIESLDRPLRANATDSTISLQPAVGSRSPRIFLLSDTLIMSIVVDGKGRNLVEFGQFVSATRTLKAEIGFPVTTDVQPSDPFARIHSVSPSGAVGTSCRFCHGDEEAVPDMNGQMIDGPSTPYVSSALRPDWRNEVPLDRVRAERATCDAAVEPDRCELLGALLDHGAVVETKFPQEIPTIFR